MGSNCILLIRDKKIHRYFEDESIVYFENEKFYYTENKIEEDKYLMMKELAK
jgi:hypothetical protein